MQETQVPSLIWEDPTYLRAAKPGHHNFWDCALESGTRNTGPTCHSCWSLHTLQPMLVTTEATAVRSPHARTREKPAQQWRPFTAKKEKRESAVPSCKWHWWKIQRAPMCYHMKVAWKEMIWKGMETLFTALKQRLLKMGETGYFSPHHQHVFWCLSLVCISESLWVPTATPHDSRTQVTVTIS